MTTRSKKILIVCGVMNVLAGMGGNEVQAQERTIRIYSHEATETAVPPCEDLRVDDDITDR